jgi:hypothetical protein
MLFRDKDKDIVERQQKEAEKEKRQRAFLRKKGGGRKIHHHFFNRAKLGNAAEIEALRESAYPIQRHDYILLDLPESQKQVPCDIKLVNIVKFFREQGLITQQCDQGQPGSYGCVTFSPNKDISVVELNTLNVLKSLFGEENIVTSSANREVFRGHQPEFIAEVNKFPDKLRVDENGQALRFNYEQMPWMHERLGIEMPRKEEALRGNVFLYCQGGRSRQGGQKNHMCLVRLVGKNYFHFVYNNGMHQSRMMLSLKTCESCAVEENKKVAAGRWMMLSAAAMTVVAMVLYGNLTSRKCV